MFSPGPFPFSNKGQLDGIYTQKQLKNYEKDLIIKTAEIAQMAYEIDTSKSNQWNLGKWQRSPTSQQAKHLTVKSVTPFDEISDDESYNTVGLIAKVDHRIGEICFVGFRGSSTEKDWLANVNLAEGVPKWPHLKWNEFYRPF